MTGAWLVFEQVWEDSSLFEEIVYLEQNVKTEFLHKLELMELFDFSCKLLEDIKEKEIMATLLEKMSTSDLLSIYELSESIRVMVSDAEWRKGAFWSYLCKLLLMLWEEGGIEISEEYRLFLLSLVMKLEQKAEYTNQYLQKILQSESYQKENYYFVWNQFKNIRLRKLAAVDNETNTMLDELYKNSFYAYQHVVKNALKPLSREQRNKNCVLVMTMQFLGEGHAPTRTVMERCKALKKRRKSEQSL